MKYIMLNNVNFFTATCRKIFNIYLLTINGLYRLNNISP